MILFLLLAEVTYYQDVAPILDRNCIACHRTGNIAPFPLTTFEQVSKHRTQIAQVTKSRYMPPWLPEGHAFKDERRLTQPEIETLSKWARSPVRGSAVPGRRDGARQTARFGTPDLELQTAEPYTLPAEGPDIFRNFIIQVPAGRTQYVRAIELDPGNPKLIHHANIIPDRTRSLRAREGMDGQPGFPGMDIVTESGGTFDPDSHFLFWKPGSLTQEEPPAQAWRLDPDTDLILNLHLRPSGKPEKIQPKVTIYYAKDPPSEFPMLLQLEHDGSIRIPPNSRDTAITDRLTLPVTVDLLRIYPHAHYLGKHVEAWAILPNEVRRELIDIPDWNLDWQGVFTYRQPVRLPKGTVVHMRITYDNTSANARNPNSPPIEVRAGDRASDEMGHVWLQVLAAGPSVKDPRLLLQEAVMTRRLEKYPSDFLAHYNLGALYEGEARHEEAEKQLRAAVQIDPKQPAARNTLAVCLAAQGRNAEALQQWDETVRLNPDYSEARFNRARALTVAGDASGAITEYRNYLARNPADAAAHLNLGNIYITMRQFAQALPEYAKACELDPTNADALTNYGTLLAQTGDLAQAIAKFKSALRIEPANETALRNLRKASSSLR